MMRRSIWVLTGALTAAAMPAVASALLVWTLVASPLTTTAKQSTTFTVTASNLTPLFELGCVQVDLQGFVIESIGTPTASNSKAWVSIQSGGSVIVYSTTGGGRLTTGQWVTFTIRAHAYSAGTFLWTNHAHQQQDCSGTAEIGLPLSVTVLPALVATPTPAPTAAPTPTPAPSLPLPSLSPLPSVSLLPSLSPLPSVSLLPSVLPGSSSPTPSPAASASSSADQASPPTGTPGPSSSTGGGGSGATGPGAAGGPADGRATPALHVERGAGNGADNGVVVDMPGLLDLNYGWLVPAAPVAVPGLLVILWVFLQAIGALAWIPSVRRMADESAAPRRHVGGRETAL
jgi:hypothetical protein